MARVEFTVRLNGTSENPFHKYGLTQNPFPEVAQYEYTGQLLHLQKLGADPIKDVQQIRDHLKGWPEWFVQGLCDRFVPGKMVEFQCYFDE